MFINIISVLCLAAVVSCKLEVKEITDNLDKVMKYLEGRGPKLTPLANDLLVWGASEMQVLPVNAKNLPAGRLDLAKSIEKRFLQFVARGGGSYTSPIEKQFMLNPQYWGHGTEYRHRPGRVTGKEPLTATLDQIIKQSMPSKESLDCMKNIFDDNKFSTTDRVCKLSCRDKAVDVSKLDSGFSLEDRINYIVFGALLNCTNDDEPARTKFATIFCEHMFRQVLAMEKQKADPKFKEAIPAYLIKVVMCGTYGYTEFFSEERVRDLLKMINPDGSVGPKDGKPELIDLLTVLMAVNLSGIVRGLSETGS